MKTVKSSKIEEEPRVQCKSQKKLLKLSLSFSLRRRDTREEFSSSGSQGMKKLIFKEDLLEITSLNYLQMPLNVFIDKT